VIRDIDPLPAEDAVWADSVLIAANPEDNLLTYAHYIFYNQKSIFPKLRYERRSI
jgi:hypothetical protein